MDYCPSPKQKPTKVLHSMLSVPPTAVIAFKMIYLVRRFILTPQAIRLAHLFILLRVILS